jgi:hypothetical protein
MKGEKNETNYDRYYPDILLEILCEATSYPDEINGTRPD